MGTGLDGTRVVLITDTHYGPLDRARWSARVCETVSSLKTDLVCHTGHIADGTAERRRTQAAERRRTQAAPPGTVRATRARLYVTGNHEYYNEARGWVDLMDELGWEPLRNRYLLGPTCICCLPGRWSPQPMTPALPGRRHRAVRGPR